jgi:Prophage tail length tape measure protein
MAIKIGSLIIRLAVEHGLLQEGLARSERDVAKTTRAIQRKGREIADFGKNLSLAISLPIAALAVSSIKAAKESADALGQVNAALASMGNQAGRTSEQLQALAGSQMRQSLFDDDQILREVTANLLTFGKVSGQEFDRAQQAALDLSTRLGTDLTSATVQIGKALNDPIKGIAALSKAGIQFTTDQKAMIASMVEAGDVASAQRIILGELEKQFGGAAQAARDADPGAAAAQAFAQFQEEIGAKLLPLLPAITAGITGLLDAFSSLPEPVQTGVVALGALAAIVGPIAIGIGSVITAASGMIAAIGGIPAVLSVVGLAFNTLLLSPLGLIVLAVGAVVAAWYYWDDIKAIVADLGRAVSGWWSDNIAPVLRWLKDGLVSAVSWWFNLHIGAIKWMAQLADGVRKWLVDKLGAVFDWVGKKIQQVTGFFFDMYDAVVGNSYVPDMVEGIRIEMAKLQAFMVDPAQRAAQSTEDVMRAMADNVRGILARLYPEIEAANAKAADIAALFGAERAGLITPAARRDAVRRAQGFDEGPLEEAGKVNEAVEQIKDSIGGLAQENEVQTVRIADTFQQMVDRILGAARTLVDGFRNGDWLSVLEGAVGLFTQLGGAGVFGSGLQGRLQGIPGNANGTAFHPGGLMMVGERGPEILQVPSGGRVTPNHELRAANDSAARAHITVGIDPRNGNITAFVDGQIAASAPGIASGGAQLAQSRLARRQTRRIG